MFRPQEASIHLVVIGPQKTMSRKATDYVSGRLRNLLRKVVSPNTYFYWAKERLLMARPSLRGVLRFPPGHFYSPLLDIEKLVRQRDLTTELALWEQVPLRQAAQEIFYKELLRDYPPLPFPLNKGVDFRYFRSNPFFSVGDAFVLSGILRKYTPTRVIEVGCGYSSAVMLDTMQHCAVDFEVTCIDPFPERLLALLSTDDHEQIQIIAREVQCVPIETFDHLDSNDVLFIDSSHVLKVGSDVTHLFMRVLPRLKPGVLIHVHDIFFPFAYPDSWLEEGRAWNESLALRTLLIGNPGLEIIAFNSFASFEMPELFAQLFPLFVSGGSCGLWLRKK